jgi:hypothetical protein
LSGGGRDGSARFRQRARTAELVERITMIAFSKLAILSEQHVLLPGAADAALDVLHATADMVQGAAVPGLTCSIENVASGGLRSLFETRHDYLVVAFGRAFPEHLVLIGCAPLGSALEISVFVTGSERLGRRLRRLLIYGRDAVLRDEVGAELGPRQAAALAARIEVVRGCVDQALADIAAPGADPFAESLEPERPHTESED